ncbi:MAG: ABC transporter ATP-binding protein [Candidatus Hodarchaeales archaeon]
MVTIQLENVSKSYEGENVLNSVNFSVKDNEFTTVIGESGSGKTTMLKIIAGLVKQDSGHVYFDGENIDDLSPGNRRIGYVPQSQVLFPHMNTFDNVSFGLRARKETSTVVESKVRSILDKVGLLTEIKKFPHQLSGGQMQRVALARSLVTEPQLLLLDEPLSSLDSFLRRQLGFLVREIQQSMSIPAIMVTHSWEEASLMSDRIAVIDKGHIIQEGCPSSILENPSCDLVIKLTGQSNIISLEGNIHGFGDQKQKQIVTKLIPGNHRIYLPEENIPSNNEWVLVNGIVTGISTERTKKVDTRRIVVRLLENNQYLVINTDSLSNSEIKIDNSALVVLAVKRSSFRLMPLE